MRVGSGAFSLLMFVASAGWLTSVSVLYRPQQVGKPQLSFSRDVLPILSDKCFKCHGPDSSSRMADLRLDTPEGALSSRSGRFPIVPFKPTHSLVVKRIHSGTARMPPSGSGKTLTAREKEIISQWIAEGARYARLWSFEPLPATVPVPKVAGSWPRDDLDRFVLDRLNRERLQPSRPASKLRWLRRVTLDLTGLPPSEEAISSFQADTKAGSFERVVDRLLASNHFGERMAVDWLDAARYSDSYGYQSDLIMPAWPYRDWVVRAFNQNLPYSRFLVDQIAGDLLPNATRDERLATAFNRLHRQSNEGGSIAAEFRNEYAVDRTDTFGTAVLGLTVGCARCHDHKFDPITQRDYYQLYAYFNSIEEFGLLLSTEIVPTPALLLPTPEQETKLNALKAAATSARAELDRMIAESSVRFNKWLMTKPATLEIPGIVTHISFDGDAKMPGRSLGKVDLVPGKSGKAIVLDGDNGYAVGGLSAKERWEPFTWAFWVNDPRAKGPVVLVHRTGGTDVGFCGFDLMLENGYLTARVMRHWPGNAVAVRTKSRIPKDSWAHVAWSWDGLGMANGLKLYIDGRPAETTTLRDRIWKKINAYGDLGASGGDWAFGQRFRDAGFRGGKVDDLVFAGRELSATEVGMLFDPNKPATSLKAYFDAAVDGQVNSAREAARKAQADLANFEEGVYEIAVMEEARAPIPAYVLARGQYDAPRTPANLVKRGVPKSLPPLPTAGANNRLALARWATQSNHPLTARVAVNRLWQMIFGTGLVETSENFGTQGSRPTHPELLDFLARRFVNSGWNVKALLKSIVLSATYRQDSNQTKAMRERDPENRLYARGPSHRLSAEMVRDTVLAASGLLSSKHDGPPVNPYQPAGIWQENNTMSPGFIQSKGSDLYCRSLYSTWKRTTPVPNILLFDATSREACMVRRPSTNTPLQALVLLNDIQYVEAARALAERVIKLKPDNASRIQAAFLRLAGRPPDRQELAILIRAIDEQRTQFKADPALAKKLVAVGESQANPSLDPIELATLTVGVQAIMNSDSVIWKR